MANITAVNRLTSRSLLTTDILSWMSSRRLALAATLLFAASCMAQDQIPAQPQLPVAPEPQDAAQAPENRPSLATIPAGTRFALVLTNPISSNTTHRGDEIHAQTTAPVTVDNQVVIPAGAFVQGKVDRLRRDGDRGEMLMQSVSVIFPDGYVANISGPINIQSDEYTAWLTPSTGAKVAAIIAPIAGVGVGAAIGSAAHTTHSTTLDGTTLTSSSPKGIAIGSGVGLGVGALAAILILTHSHQFFVDVGSPMQMTLPQPLTITENQVTDSVREARENPMAFPLAPHRVWP
jgi:hypothetical protein